MPRSDETVRTLALRYFREHGMTLQDAILRAAAELQVAANVRSDVDEPGGYSWRPGVGRMTGAGRNNG